MNPDKLYREMGRWSERIFPGARLIILEQFPHYLKIRLMLDDTTFIEVCLNVKSNHRSYVLVKDMERIAGFDNLGGWHIHPYHDPDNHRKIKKTSIFKALDYFKKCLRSA